MAEEPKYDRDIHTRETGRSARATSVRPTASTTPARIRRSEPAVCRTEAALFSIQPIVPIKAVPTTVTALLVRVTSARPTVSTTLVRTRHSVPAVCRMVLVWCLWNPIALSMAEHIRVTVPHASAILTATALMMPASRRKEPAVHRTAHAP